MAKAVMRSLRGQQKDFQKLFSTLCDRHSAWEVWSDFINLAAITISNAVDRQGKDHDERENLYTQIIQRYIKAEQAVMPELFDLMVTALDENPDQDFLGEMFMVLELGNHWKGQFFTPYCICEAMARMQVERAEEIVAEKGWVSVFDCACGAGALLIAARNELARRNVPYTTAPPRSCATFSCLCWAARDMWWSRIPSGIR